MASKPAYYTGVTKTFFDYSKFEFFAVKNEDEKFVKKEEKVVMKIEDEMMIKSDTFELHSVEYDVSYSYIRRLKKIDLPEIERRPSCEIPYILDPRRIRQCLRECLDELLKKTTKWPAVEDLMKANHEDDDSDNFHQSLFKLQAPLQSLTTMDMHTGRLCHVSVNTLETVSINRKGEAVVVATRVEEERETRTNKIVQRMDRHAVRDSDSSTSYSQSYTAPILDSDSDTNSTSRKSNDFCPDLVDDQVGAPLSLRLKLNTKDNQWFVKLPDRIREKSQKKVETPPTTSDEASESDGRESLNQAINATIKQKTLREIRSNSREESTEQLLAEIDAFVRDDSVTSSGIVDETSEMTTRIGTAKSPRISRVPVSVTGEELVTVNKEALNRTINSFKKTAERKRHVYKKPNKLDQMRKELSLPKQASNEFEITSPILIDSSPEQSRHKSRSPVQHRSWADLPSTSFASPDANEFAIEPLWESRSKNPHAYSSPMKRRPEKNLENITPNKIRDRRGRSLGSPIPDTIYSRDSSDRRRRSDDSRERYGKRTRSRSPPRSRRFEASSSRYNYPSSSSEDARYSRESSRYKVRRRHVDDDDQEDRLYRSLSKTPDHHRHYRKESRNSSVLSSDETKPVETSDNSRKHKRKHDKDSRSESHSKHKKRKGYVIPKLSSSADSERDKSVDSGHSTSPLMKKIEMMSKLSDRVNPDEHLETEQIVNNHRKHKRDRYSVDSGIGSEPVSSETPEVLGNAEKKVDNCDLSKKTVDSESIDTDYVEIITKRERLIQELRTIDEVLRCRDSKNQPSSNAAEDKIDSPKTPSIDEIDRMLERALDKSNAGGKLANNHSVDEESSVVDKVVPLSTFLRSTPVQEEDPNAQSVKLTKESMKSIQAKVNSPTSEDLNPPKLDQIMNVVNKISESTIGHLQKIKINNQSIKQLKQIKKKVVNMLATQDYSSDEDDPENPKMKIKSSKSVAVDNEKNEKVKSVEAIDNASNVIRSLRDKAVKESQLNASTKDMSTNTSPSESSQNTQTDEHLANLALIEKEKLLSLQEPVDFQYSSEDLDKFVNEITERMEKSQQSESNKPESPSQIRVFTSKELGSAWENCPTPAPPAQKLDNQNAQSVIVRQVSNPPVPGLEDTPNSNPPPPCVSLCTIQIGILNGNVPAGTSQIQIAPAAISIVPTQSLAPTKNTQDSSGQSVVYSKQIPVITPIIPTPIVTTQQIPQIINRQIVPEPRSSPNSGLPNPRNVFTNVVTSTTPIFTSPNVFSSMPTTVQQPVVEQELMLRSAAYAQSGGMSASIQQIQAQVQQMNSGTFVQTQMTVNSASAPSTMYPTMAPNFNPAPAPNQSVLNGSNAAPASKNMQPSSYPPPPYPSNSLRPPPPSVKLSGKQYGRCNQPNCLDCKFQENFYYNQSILQKIFEIAQLLRQTMEKFRMGCRDPREQQRFRQYILHFFTNTDKLFKALDNTKFIVDFIVKKSEYALNPQLTHDEFAYFMKYFNLFMMQKNKKTSSSSSGYYNQNPNYCNAGSSGATSYAANMAPQAPYNYPAGFSQTSPLPKPVPPPRHSTMPNCPPNIQPVPAPTTPATSYASSSVPLVPNLGIPTTSKPVKPKKKSTQQKGMTSQQKKQFSEQLRVFENITKRTERYLQEQQQHQVDNANVQTALVNRDPRLNPNISKQRRSRNDSTQDDPFPAINLLNAQTSQQVPAGEPLLKSLLNAGPQISSAELPIPSVQPLIPSAEPQIPSVQPQIPSVQSQIPSVQPQIPGVQPQIPGVKPQIPSVQPQISSPRLQTPSSRPSIPSPKSVIQTRSPIINAKSPETNQSSPIQATPPSTPKEQNKDQAFGNAINFNDAINALRNIPHNYAEAQVLRRSPRQSGSTPPKTQTFTPPEPIANSSEPMAVEPPAEPSTPSTSSASDPQLESSTLQESSVTTTEFTSTEAESNEEHPEAQPSPSAELDKNNESISFSWECIKKESNDDETEVENLHHGVEDQSFTFSLDNIDENKYYNEEDDDNDILIDFESIIDIKQEPQEVQETPEEKYADQLKKDEGDAEDSGTAAQSAPEESSAVEEPASDAMEIKKEASDDRLGRKDGKASTNEKDISIITLDSDDDDDQVDDKNRISFKNTNVPLVAIKNELIYPEDNMDLGFLNDSEVPKQNQKQTDAKLSERSSKVDGKTSKPGEKRSDLERKSPKLNEKNTKLNQTSDKPKSSTFKDSAPANSSSKEANSSSKKTKDTKRPEKTCDEEIIIIDDDDEDENPDDIDKSSTISSDRETVKLNLTNEDLMIEDENIVSESYKYDYCCIDEEIECLQISEGRSGAEYKTSTFQQSNSSEPSNADNEMGEIKPLDSDGDIYDVTDIKIENNDSSFSFID